MAQLISFVGAPGSPGMPHVPAFQYWAMRGANGTSTTPFVGRGAPPPGFWGMGRLAGGLKLFFVVCGDNTAHAIVGALVTLKIATTTNVTFEFEDGGGPAPGNIAVTVANGATAAQCATALISAISGWLTANMPAAAAAVPAGFGFGTDTVEIVNGDPAVPLLVTTGGTGPLAVTNNNGQVYGDALLHRAWRTFVYQGVDPAGVSVFPTVDGIAPDIAIPFWPLHPLARKAWPWQFLNPFANEKPEDD